MVLQSNSIFICLLRLFSLVLNPRPFTFVSYLTLLLRFKLIIYIYKYNLPIHRSSNLGGFEPGFSVHIDSQIPVSWGIIYSFGIPPEYNLHGVISLGVGVVESLLVDPTMKMMDRFIPLWANRTLERTAMGFNPFWLVHVMGAVFRSNWQGNLCIGPEMVI